MQIYEQYLGLRVNRILYGSSQDDFDSGKKLHRTSNIIIVDEETEQSEKRSPNKEKKQGQMQGQRLSFTKKTKETLVNG